MENAGRKMGSIFTAVALIKEQGLAAMLMTVECCALAQYQVGIMHKALSQ